ncbi:DUF262 domain-containing protein [Paenibacillus sp. MER 180]|uniref:GmrSD restriction endonuclease domain-containing protein n=1 Tax=Paenibacillus sp. MER 180 TaxID=2939570 RepID=UPI00203E0C02|nr:DUF262 domain-containing protein [Paenibacillus sp. MER 180]MCM3289676.1 DUF262 domain-containing protein [Paenibacillus sp. MER 180]
MSNLEQQLNEQKRKVDFNTFDISVKELISMVGDGLIDIAPEYQRQFRWEANRQSSLIESIFLGIPIPSLYMATNPDGGWELIDGVQRLSSIVHFAADEEIRKKIIKQDEPLKISGLKKFSELNNKKFSDLSKTVQLAFTLKPLKVTTLSDKSDLDVRFDLFERLNTGGVKLSDQEIRSCIFRGKFNDFIKELAKNEDFKKVALLPEAKEQDGTREELVLRFFAYLNNYEEFDHSVVDFLNNYMKASIKQFEYEQNEELFKKVFQSLSVALPEGITRGRNTTPVNLFEAVSVGAALALKESGKLLVEGIQNWIANDELTQLTSGATNSRPRVKSRIEYCKEKFEGK